MISYSLILSFKISPRTKRLALKFLQELRVFLSHKLGESGLRVRSSCALAQNSLSLCFVTEYDSDTSCHYKVELSYENFITSGPDPHPPPIADDESDDDDDDDIPQVRAPLKSICVAPW